MGNVGGVCRTLKPSTAKPALEQDSSTAAIAELKEKLRLAMETNGKLTSRLQSSEARNSKLANAKSHLVRKLRESHSRLRSHARLRSQVSQDASVCDALMGQMQNLQFEHDQLAEKYHATKKQQQTLALRSNQVSELQSEVNRLRRIHTLETRLLDLFRELGRSRCSDHSRYSPLGKAIRQAEQDLAEALKGAKA